MASGVGPFAAAEKYLALLRAARVQRRCSPVLQVADRQQQFFMDNKRFAADLTDLGFGANPYVVGDDGAPTVATDTEAVYSLSLSNVAATTWTVTAAPLHGQLSRDTYCGSLSITQAGTKGKTGASDDCW